MISPAFIEDLMRSLEESIQKMELLSVAIEEMSENIRQVNERMEKFENLLNNLNGKTNGVS